MEAVAFAAPRTEEMTRTAIGFGGGLVTGLAEGVVIKFAPGLGALQPVVTWGTLLTVPLIGVAGGLFTRGLISDLFRGVADAGAGILGYSLPALIAPYMPTGGKGGEGDGAKKQPGRGGVKELPAGAGNAPLRAQTQARVGLEF